MRSVVVGSSTVDGVTQSTTGTSDLTTEILLNTDLTAPTLIGFSSTTSNGSYKAGSTINITATLSEDVNADAEITVTLDTGETVVLTSSSFGATLAGSYTVGSGKNSADLTVSSYVLTNAPSDEVGNIMTSTTLPTGENNIAGAKEIVIDTAAPTITSLSSSSLNGTFGLGSTITITATASEIVQAGSTFTITLETGSVDQTVTMTASANGTAFTGTYTVQAGDTSADLTATAFTAGTVDDIAGNAMTATTLPTGANNIAGAKEIVIDGTAPVLSATSASSLASTSATLNFTSSKTGSYYYLIYAASEPAPSAATVAAQGTAVAKGTSSALASANTANVTGLSPGTAYKAYVVVKDAATNSSTVSTIDFRTIGATPDLAAASDLGVSDSDNTTADNTPTFTVSGSFAGTAVLTATKAGSTSVSCTLSSGSCTLATLANGEWTISVTDTDSLGNSTTSPDLTITVDTTAPTITAITSSSTDGTYKFGSAITISATASKIIQAGSTFTITLETGTPDRIITMTAGANGTTLTGTYTVQAGDLTADLTATAFTAGIVVDVAGNAMTATTLPTGANNIAGAKAIVVDGVVPSATVTTASVIAPATATVQSTKAGTLYLVNTSVTVTDLASITGAASTLQTSKVVTTASTTLATTGLTPGTYKAYSVDAAGNLSAASTGILTVQPATPGAPDLAAASDSGSSTTDNNTSNNTPTFDLTGLTAGATVTITATPISGSPVTCVVVASATTGSCIFSTLLNGTYSVKVKQSINGIDSADSTLLSGVVINSTTVATPATPDLQTASDLGTSSTDNITSDSTPTFTVTGTLAGTGLLTATKTGSTSVSCTLASGSCTLAALADGDWSVTVKDTDTAGNNSTSAALVVTIDTTAPTVTNVTSSTANGTYKAGDSISIQVTFNEAVVVSGTPALTMNTTPTSRTASYTSGSGTNTLTFTYTVLATDTSADLNYAATTSLSATINDLAGNASARTLPATTGAGSLGTNKNIVIDTTVPTVSSVTATNTNGTYKTGDTIRVQATFSEAVIVTGTPQITLKTGGTNRTANYASGSGTSVLLFDYVVQAGDTTADLDYVATTSLALNSGTIKDAGGNVATLTLAAPAATNSLGNSKAIVIDQLFRE
jgi:hypothetical protein